MWREFFEVNTMALNAVSAPVYRLPLMDLDTAQGVLDCSEGWVLKLLNAGALIALNIGGGTEHRCLRFFTASVIELQSPRVTNRLDHRCSTSKNRAIASLMPRNLGPVLRSHHVQRALCCTYRQVIRLIRNGEFEQAPGTQFRRGPKGEARITRESFNRFCHRRYCT